MSLFQGLMLAAQRPPNFQVKAPSIQSQRYTIVRLANKTADFFLLSYHVNNPTVSPATRKGKTVGVPHLSSMSRLNFDLYESSPRQHTFGALVTAWLCSAPTPALLRRSTTRANMFRSSPSRSAGTDSHWRCGVLD